MILFRRAVMLFAVATPLVTGAAEPAPKKAPPAAPAKAPAAKAPSFAGHWVSEAVEPGGNGTFASREFKLTDKTWHLTYTVFGDEAKKSPLVAMTFEGPWAITGDSGAVMGAKQATFEFKKKTITLKAKDPGVAKNFGMDACGLAPGKAKDVSKTGCSFVASVEKYGKEFDLVKLEGDRLFLGSRPADGDMSAEDKRPTALGPALVKAKK